jgi:predicted O-methyltransferase YrrM
MTLQPGELHRFFPLLEPARVQGPGPRGERGWGFWTVPPQRAAITCTDDEAYLLYRAVVHLQPRHILEIGAYVGWSTAHLAYAAPHPPIWVVDDFSEHTPRLTVYDSSTETLFWQHLRAAGLDKRVALCVGRSPEALPAITPPGGWDFVFLDGWHQDGQPLRDVCALARASHPATVLALHDTWIHDVAQAGQWLRWQGWHVLACATPGALAFYYRVPPTGWREFQEEAQL